MRKLIVFIMIAVLSAAAETLFEVKDSSDHTVLNVSTDGLRILNYPDTLMVISTTEIKAVIDDSKVLSRKFSVTTSSSKKTAGTDVFEVTTADAKIRKGDGAKYTDFSPENIFLGLYAGMNTVPNGNEGQGNVFIGNNAGYANGSGRSNIFIGDWAGFSNTIWHFNTFIGSNAGYNSNGSDNTFVGCSSGYSNQTGQGNAIFGDFAGAMNSSGNDNSIFGHGAGIYSTGGGENTIMGSLAGRGASSGGSTGSYNCMFGSEAGTLAAGSSNVMIGRQSGFSSSTGSGNVFLGNQSGYNETGSNKLYIDNSDISTPLIYGDFSTNYLKINGSMALSSGASVSEFSIDGTMGGNSDTAVPTEKAVRTYVTASKDNLGNHTATQNIRLSGYYLSSDGGNEGVYVDAEGDVGIGTNAPGSNRLKVISSTAVTNVAGATGYFENTYSGGIGLAALATSTDVALYAEQKNSTSTTANIAKFASMYGGWSEKLTIRSTGRIYAPYLATGTGTALYMSGTEIVKYSSSKKYKKNIVPLAVNQENFMRLQPVSFKWNEKSASENKPDYGLIAEEVEKIDPDLAVYNEDGSIEGVNYQKVNIMLLKVVQDQQNKIDELEKRIDRIEKKK